MPIATWNRRLRYSECSSYYSTLDYIKKAIPLIYKYILTPTWENGLQAAEFIHASYRLLSDF